MYHPFWDIDEEVKNGFDWSIKKALDPSTHTDEYYYSFYSSVLMSRDNKFKKSTEFNYAHHLDATKFGHFCKEKCNNIEHVLGHVESVPLNSNGEIDRLIFKDGRVIKSDLYVDCTGFTALLLDKTLKEEFISTDEILLNDSAVVTRVPYLDSTKKDEILPYTDCTALSSGWAWNIPLWSRVGTGYVYSSKYLTKDEAQEEFKRYLVDRFGERIDDIEFNHITIRAGKHKRAWVKNCTSLVLSSGFVEPLESTGLALMANQVKQLVSILTKYQYNSLDREFYNSSVSSYIDEVAEFISLHYSSTEREDTPYWSYISNNIKIPENMLRKLSDIVKEKKSIGNVFPYKSWENILIGFEVLFTDYYNKEKLLFHNTPIDRLQGKDRENVLNDVTKYIEDLREKNEHKVKSFQGHYSYLLENLYTNKEV
jgi:tryptophan halogenase